jgi:hypothetical protein
MEQVNKTARSYHEIKDCMNSSPVDGIILQPETAPMQVPAFRTKKSSKDVIGSEFDYLKVKKQLDSASELLKEMKQLVNYSSEEEGIII